MRFQLLQILPHVWHELHIRHSCKRFAKVWWENGFQNKIVQFVCCSFCVSVLNWFKIHLKAVVFLHAFEEPVDCHLLSSFCDDSNLHISLFKYVLSTMGVSKESTNKCLIGNRFHVKLCILSPENWKQSLRVKSWKAERSAEKKQTQDFNQNFVAQAHKS